MVHAPETAGGRRVTRVILVVDDEPDILLTFRELIEIAIPGVRVLTASSGANALEILARERVDVLMSDFKMPGMDGAELLARAREVAPGAFRVLFTALADDELEERVLADGLAHAFLAKHLDPAAILERVAGYSRAARAGG